MAVTNVGWGSANSLPARQQSGTQSHWSLPGDAALFEPVAQQADWKPRVVRKLELDRRCVAMLAITLHDRSAVVVVVSLRAQRARSW
jgi:hypothetical protein